MRTIVFLQGAPGSGKSTFIHEKGLEPYVLSADSIRMMLSSLQMGIDDMEINARKDFVVFKYFNEFLENRMKDGAFTIIDNTNCSSKSFEGYKGLVKKYRYRAYIVKFDVPLETLLERNKHRGYKAVPEEVIIRMRENFDNFEYHNWYKVISPEEFSSEIENRWDDKSCYEQIVHIGDVHGCYSALRNINFNNKRNLYIFMGDYFDRGIQNGEVADLLFSIRNNSNVVFLYGNHELHIEKYLETGKAPNEEFQKTIDGIHRMGLKNDFLKEFVRKLVPVYTYTYGDKRIICTHAGISFEPDDIRKIDQVQFIKGIGGYDFNVDKIFVGKTENTYQVHGHRNILNLPIAAGPKSFNLNSSIEGGEALRTLILDKNGFSEKEYPCTVFNPEFHPKNSTYRALVRDNDIVKKEFGNVISFNFSRETFWGKKWNSKTILARGLFCDKDTKLVLARGYEKFFMLHENESTTDDAIKRLKYPLTAYRKENGYLGLLGINNGELMFCSKSSIDSDFAEWFKQIFMKTVSNPKKVRDYLIKNDACMAFEVLDTTHDPHIIPGDEHRCVLLDVFKRDYKFERLEYSELQKVAESFGLDCKIKEATFSNFEELQKFANTVSDYEYCLNGQKIEGFVIEDSSNEVFHFKLKTGYYTFWKIIRNVIERNQIDDFSIVMKNLHFYDLINQKPIAERAIKNFKDSGQMTLFELQTSCE